MRDVVRTAFYDFSARYEGAVDFLYQDVLGLVSIGVGILADPITLAYHLPLVRKSDGQPATRAEIEAEWHKIKTLPPDKHGRSAALLGHLYAKPHTTLKLNEAGLRSTLLGKLDLHNTLLVARFPDFELWPSDAQLATHSMAWACGAHFKFPKLAAALLNQDFRTAAIECHIRTDPAPDQPHGNPGVIPRNKANKTLYTNAAIVMEQKLDPETLHWPTNLSTGLPQPGSYQELGTYQEHGSSVRHDQLEDDPQPIIHDLNYPTGYKPGD